MKNRISIEIYLFIVFWGLTAITWGNEHHSSLLTTIEKYDSLPWDGEVEEGKLKIRYKKYPRFINMLSISEDIPWQQERSPLYITIARSAFLASKRITDSALQQKFYQLAEDTQTYRKFLQKSYPDMSENEMFQQFQQSRIQSWCLGEISCQSYSAIICLEEFQKNPPRPSAIVAYFFIKRMANGIFL